MPVVQTTAYATVEGTFKLARALVNDMLLDQAGEILTDAAPFMFPLLNEAADYFAGQLENHGVKTFTKETVLTPIPACHFPAMPLGATDPGQQVNISDVGYFDGSAQHYPPQLPTDMIAPQVLWERATGQIESWKEMTEYPDGLPSITQGQRLACWEWRTERIYMPGATQTNDVRMRYEGETAQFATVNDTIMIRRSQSALANYLAALVVNARNPMAAASCSAAGDSFTNQIIISNVRAMQRETITRQSYGSQGMRRN